MQCSTAELSRQKWESESNRRFLCCSNQTELPRMNREWDSNPRLTANYFLANSKPSSQVVHIASMHCCSTIHNGAIPKHLTRPAWYCRPIHWTNCRTDRIWTYIASASNWCIDLLCYCSISALSRTRTPIWSFGEICATTYTKTPWKPTEIWTQTPRIKILCATLTLWVYLLRHWSR